MIEPGQTSGRAPEGHTQLVLRARDAFARRWEDVASDVVTKNLLSSLALALPEVCDRIASTHLGRTRQTFFGVGHYRALANFQRVQEDRRSLGRAIYWAGDYLSGPRFDDAVRSGRRAARALIADFDGREDGLASA